MFNDILNALPLIQAGKLRPIRVTAARRAGALPDVPALSVIGLPTFDIGIRLALFAPAKTPAAVIADLNGKIRGMANEPGLRPRYHEQGIQVIESAAPYELIHSFRHEIVGWSKLVQDAGLAHSQ